LVQRQCAEPLFESGSFVMGSVQCGHVRIRSVGSLEMLIAIAWIVAHRGEQIGRNYIEPRLRARQALRPAR